MTYFAPCTPGGTLCMWLKARTEEEAWKNLMRDASHMPYKDKKDFIARGYTIDKMVEISKPERKK